MTRRQLFGRLLGSAVGVCAAKMVPPDVIPMKVRRGLVPTRIESTHLRSPAAYRESVTGELNARWIADTKDFIAAVNRADDAVRGMQV